MEDPLKGDLTGDKGGRSTDVDLERGDESCGAVSGTATMEDDSRPIEGKMPEEFERVRVRPRAAEVVLTGTSCGETVVVGVSGVRGGVAAAVVAVVAETAEAVAATAELAAAAAAATAALAAATVDAGGWCCGTST